MARLLIGLLLLAIGVAQRPAVAKGIVADIDHHLIAITTDFSGDDVLIFGAVDQPGDVVMALRGRSPRYRYTIRSGSPASGSTTTW